MPTAPLRYCTYPGCTRRVQHGRCVEHETDRDRARGTRDQRGYGSTHLAARARLIALLPLPCGYGCGTTLTTPADLVAAHIEDGNPTAGYLASCRRCNEQHKRR